MGQLKWMATNAAAELEAGLPGGAGTGVWAVVQDFSATNNWLTVNVGQLKQVAAPFYDRLIAVGFTNDYPWTSNTTTDDVDYAIANIGQLKELFGFDATTDADADTLPDWWEIKYFGSIAAQNAAGDPDGDGLTNIQEFSLRTNPDAADTDSDGLNDGVETGTGIYVGPTNTGSNPTMTDSDGDGINDGTEVANRTDPNVADTTVPTIIITAPANGQTVRVFP
ncbi:MAG: hypothetical protein C0404_13355 [Verrucomicrobia bacterium]|nr:hypothetical protein [Verrucomicrobiota bacterium]